MRFPVAWFHGAILVAASVVPGCNAPDDSLGPVGEFSLTERSGKQVTREDLHGKVWVAAFVFTLCTGPCSQISATMAQLQHELQDEKDVVLVSFSVDPEHDTPEVLQEYAERFNADPERWLLLTGEQDKIYDLARHSFLVAVEQNQGTARTPGNKVTHSTRLFVVDRHGQIRGRFDGRNVDDAGQAVNDVPLIKKKIATLLRERP